MNPVECIGQMSKLQRSFCCSSCERPDTAMYVYVFRDCISTDEEKIIDPLANQRPLSGEAIGSELRSTVRGTEDCLRYRKPWTCRLRILGCRNWALMRASYWMKYGDVSVCMEKTQHVGRRSDITQCTRELSGRRLIPSVAMR